MEYIDMEWRTGILTKYIHEGPKINVFNNGVMGVRQICTHKNVHTHTHTHCRIISLQYNPY